MAVNPKIASSDSYGVITTATVCDVVNALPEEVRRLVVKVLKECEPIYPWTVSWDGRLECRC